MDNMNFNDLTKTIRKNSKKFSGRKAPGGAGVAGAGMIIATVIASLGFNSFYKVPAGHNAIKFNRWGGIREDVFGEGLRFLVPYMERPILYDCRLQTFNTVSVTGSKDLQMVNLNVKIIHKPDPRKLPTIYRELGLNYADRILPSLAPEVMKSVVALYDADELIVKREEVSRMIRRMLTERSRRYNIIVSDVSINSLSFGDEYTKAVEDKQVAKQESERARYEVEKAKQEKKSKIVTAEGEAKSIELFGSEIQRSDAYLKLRRIDLARDISDTLKRSPNKIYLDSEDLLVSLRTEDLEIAANQDRL